MPAGRRGSAIGARAAATGALGEAEALAATDAAATPDVVAAGRRGWRITSDERVGVLTGVKTIGAAATGVGATTAAAGAVKGRCHLGA